MFLRNFILQVNQMKFFLLLIFIITTSIHVCIGAEAIWSLQCKVEASDGRIPPRVDFNIKSEDLTAGEEYIGTPPQLTSVYIPFYKEWNETFWISRETGEFLHIRNPLRYESGPAWVEKGHCALKTKDLKF